MVENGKCWRCRKDEEEILILILIINININSDIID